MKKLKIGFLIDETTVDYYIWDLICHLNDNELFEAPVLITGYKKKKTSLKQKITSIFSRNIFLTINLILKLILRNLIKKLEYQRTINKFPNYGKKFDVRKIFKDKKISIKGEWSKSGIYLDFTEDDIKKISSTNLDCIIRCGSGILKGKILDIFPFGILSFHHGDNRVIRGSPSGFWEVLNNHPSSGFIIQRLNNELDGGDVLVRGNIMTEKFWYLNNAQLLEKSNIFFKKLLYKIAVDNSLPKIEKKIVFKKKIFKLNTSSLLKYFLKILLPKILKNIIFLDKLNLLFGRKVERWNIAYSNNDNFKMSFSNFKEIKNLKNSFFADPFIFKKDDLNIIFVENFNYLENKGCISAISINNNGYKYLGDVLKENFHLSFPFIFEWNEEIFMVPETHQKKEIRLYKCDEFPMKWNLHKVLMKNVNAADTLIIRKDNIWFMLTNICSAGYGDHQSELHIYYSKDLFSNNWSPIKSGNPVIFDSMRARNGGFFLNQNNLYRVNQIHDKNHYGKSFGINKIECLNENEYVESRISNVDPSFKKNIISTHHFSADGKIAVVDFCKMEKI